MLTTLKENPLVEVSAISPDPADAKNATIMASWTYGLGRTAVLTTDAGARWANNWTGWENYDKFFSQFVRWSMRPTGDQGNYTVATQTKDGKVRVVITALDKNDELLNFLDMSASVVGPKMKSTGFSIQQESPGRYIGEFDADKSGSYFLTVTPGPGKPPIRTGVNVPYSAEFRDRETNSELLELLADLNPEGGKPGKLIPGNSEDSILSVNTFRRDLAPMISTRDIWPLIVLVTSCIFFCDVFIRRVNIGFEWVPPLWNRVKDSIMGREAPEEDDRMERLRNRKKEVGGANRRASRGG